MGSADLQGPLNPRPRTGGSAPEDKRYVVVCYGIGSKTVLTVRYFANQVSCKINNFRLRLAYIQMFCERRKKYRSLKEEVGAKARNRKLCPFFRGDDSGLYLRRPIRCRQCPSPVKQSLSFSDAPFKRMRSGKGRARSKKTSNSSSTIFGGTTDGPGRFVTA